MAEGTKNQRIERSSKIEWVPISLMRVSPLAQREKKEYRVDRIVAHFDPDKLGVPTVSHRDGFYYIVDGQHRIDALEQMGMGDQKVQSTVYENLTEQEEAAMFLQLNDVLVVGVMDKYRVGVVAEVKDATDIDKITRQLGLKVGLDKGGGNIKAVGTLRKIYARSGPTILKRALWLINETYGEGGFGAMTLEGVSLVVDRYGTAVDDTYFIERLGSYKGGVNGLLQNAETLRRQLGQAKGLCTAAAVVNIYNSGKHPGIKNLKDWWKPDE